MWFVLIDDTIAAEYKSPVAAELYAKQLRRLGFDAIVLFDEGGR